MASTRVIFIRLHAHAGALAAARGAAEFQPRAEAAASWRLTKSGDIQPEWQETLDRSLGTKEWRSAFYRTEEDPDLFEGQRSKTVKDADPMKLEKFYLNRLRTIFPTVMNTSVRLTNSKDQTMYLLCFACANPSPKAKALVSRLAGSATKA